MAFNYQKLLGRITEKMGSQAEFARRMELSERTISLKLNGKVPFKQNEIVKASNLLEIDNSDIAAYFFTVYVQ
jgi:transcriptional regulator with XRE-family HTH domain